MKKLKGKFLQLYTSNKKLSYNGLLLDYNDELTLLRSVPVDYEIDGFIVLLNKHLKEYQIGENERFHEKIVKLKLKNTRKYPALRISLSSFDETIKAVSKKYGIFALHPMTPGICYLGTIYEMDEKTITIENLSPKAKWDGIRTFKKSEIRSIEFGTDYVESLKLLAKPIW